MKTRLLSVFFILFSVTAFSQEYIFGKVKSEFGNEIVETVVINIRSGEKVLTDKDGNFMISAKPYDELRFVKSGFERFDKKISADDYSHPLNISLNKVPYLITEVEIAFQPTGNLKKDSKTLDPPKKVVALNSSMDSYMRTPLSEVPPKLTTPSAFDTQKMNGGIDFIGLAFAAIKLVGKATKNPLTTANYAETQEFYRRVKNEIDLSFYTSQGWDEEEIDRFLIYADNNFSLAKKYRNNFNSSAISNDMRLAYKEYVKTRKVKT